MYTLFSAFNRMNGLLEFWAGGSSFSNTRKHKGPSLVFCFSAALKMSGTVNKPEHRLVEVAAQPLQGFPALAL